MADPIRLLEDRVGHAVERLARLSRERADLRREVEHLRERVAQLERAAQDVSLDAQESWHRDRDRVVSALRETLVELRGE